MDKAWVWLPRASREYVEGATNFVTASSRRLGNPSEIFCPCIDCRNVCNQLVDTVVDHLVIKGMDKKYMRNSCWSMHGERKSDISDSVPTSETEAYDLLRTAYFTGEGSPQPLNIIGGETEEGTLSGCKVKGKQACNVCGKDTPCRWLKNCRKYVYMGNRKRLRPGHPYRRRKAWFDNTIEEGTAKRVQSGTEIFDILKDFRNDFGRALDKEAKRKRSDLLEDEAVPEEECDESTDQWRWKKRSILFELAYWKDLPVRHNIDVMHVEKNLSDAMLSTLMQSAKSKDGLKARKDLEDIGIRRHLHPEVRGKKTYLPPAAYWMSKEEKKVFCKRLSNFRGPDGYCGNIANCVSVNPPVIGSLKYMKTLKAYVKNYARPEACMAEGYLAGECISFCLEFLQNSVPVQEAVNRNEDVEADGSVVEGRPLHKGREVVLSEKERDIAHRYVLMNLAAVDPYVEMHLEELQSQDARCARNETILWKYHTDQFAQCIKKKIPSNSKDHSTKLRWLAFGPRLTAHTHKGFVINGHRFHTDDVKRKTQNSGVTYEAFSMCRSTARDTRQMADIVTYYGVIKEIILLDYHMFTVPLFKCSWANRGYGVKEEDGFTLVNLHMNQSSYLQDPYILPSQAKQVFYSRENDTSPWYVVMRAPPRGYHELETEEEFVGAPLSPQPVDDLEIQSSDDESFYVREDCEGITVAEGGLVRRSKRQQGLDAVTVMQRPKATKTKKKRIGEVMTDVVNLEEAEEAVGDLVQDVQKSGDIAAEEVVGGPVQEVQKSGDVVAEEADGDPDQTVSEKEVANTSQQPFEQVDAQDDDETVEPMAVETDNMNQDSQPVASEPNAREDDSQRTDAGTEMRSTSGLGTPQSAPTIKKRRGPTKMRKVAKDPQDRVEVSFTELGEHVGPGSVTLSSFVGAIVREHVPVTLDDWRKLDSQTKDTLWEEIQGRFNLQEEWQKESVFKQMGCIWRSSKSKLLGLVRDAKSSTERMKLKPSNIPSIPVWNSWIKSRTSTAFKEKSNKFRALRRAQIPHTTSRKGMFRLAHEMKKKSDDPKKITRSKVWIAGHTHADGRPVRPEFADTIEQIQSLDSQMDSTSGDNIREDAVSKVLGKEKPGRVRGMGRGITATKLAFIQARDSRLEELHNEVEDLKNQIRDLAGKNKNSGAGTSQSEVSDVGKGVRCQILDWYANKDIVVGEGEFCSAEPQYRIGRIPLGEHGAAVIVTSVSVPEASLWRPTADVFLLQQALGVKIAWPVDKVILDSGLDSQNNSENTGGCKDTGTDDDQLGRCKVFDWKMDEVIAEGVICSTNKDELIDNIPLGLNAVILIVDLVLKPEACLWRPSPEMFVMGDALKTKIAWPVHRLELMDAPEEAVGRKSSTPSASNTIRTGKGAHEVGRRPSTPSVSTTSTGKGVKKKCILLDCNNSGRKVAEGRVCSTDPAVLIHHVPLGQNASKVWVEVSKIDDACVWRPNSEIEYISDAIGTTVAWPNDKLLFI
ncbi:unnamed protein product [Arabidopsis arenosa]|uniref:Uncharacterized protein n=1 Tax=Arabidopsis arenosa TaxID=38785 RepID=A0A8S1ZI60_ARAAE|nr:unnamed protein product [Arabidopsis arenosa]